MNPKTLVRYSGPAIALHWLIALVVAAGAGIGIYMAEMPEAAAGREALYDLHRSIGVTVFVLLLARAAWRAMRKPPELISSMPRLQRIAAKATHIALYALLAIVPVTGYLMSNLEGEAVKVFGLSLPTLVASNEAAAGFFQEAHGVAAWALIVLAGLHALAALKHHFIDRDATLRRMLPARRE